ncbi:MAG TPA: transcription antitermination factor NusB [Candidatus Acidoferrales bacterium]|nr:transcription antitermination factor NusB [Candidatus Acidoferrales bacterium]
MPSRRQAREAALQALYAIAVGHREPGEALSELVGDANESDYRAFVKDLVTGTLDHAAEADLLLAPLLEGWTIERLPTIDRLLLEMGTFELRHRPQTPRAVVINEAVELAKRFSTEDSNRFVNGVLNAIAKETTQA